MSCIRTYSPPVRVGNWYEETKLHEDQLNNYVEKRERGELLTQRLQALLSAPPAMPSQSRDGQVRHGDRIQLTNHKCSVMLSLHLDACTLLTEGAEAEVEPGISAAHVDQLPTANNVFIVVSAEGCPSGQPLTFGETFYLRTVVGELYLQTDLKTFGPDLERAAALMFDRGEEMEGEPVQADQLLVVKDSRANQALAVDINKPLKSPLMTKDFAVAFLPCKRAEKFHWQIVMQKPESEQTAAVGSQA